MSWQSHTLQMVYLLTPLFSLIGVLIVLTYLVWALHRAWFPLWGWAAVTFGLLLVIANGTVFFHVYGVYAGRAVLG